MRDVVAMTPDAKDCEAPHNYKVTIVAVQAVRSLLHPAMDRGIARPTGGCVATLRAKLMASQS